MKDKDSVFILRKAVDKDLAKIWQIIQCAIRRRARDGSRQWQDGYPNENTIKKDTEAGQAYVCVRNGEVVGYAALIAEVEPAYEEIADSWKKRWPYLVIHRVAVSDQALGSGVATQIFILAEDVARKQKISSIRVDTNFDNPGMLRVFEKLEYEYRGEVYFRGSARKAFEKVLL